MKSIRALLAWLAPLKLVAVYEHTVRWTDAGLDEKITFLLLENAGGRRGYRVDQYGYCKLYDMQRQCVAPVRAWLLGGRLPPGARPAQRINRPLVAQTQN